MRMSAWIFVVHAFLPLPFISFEFFCFKFDILLSSPALIRFALWFEHVRWIFLIDLWSTTAIFVWFGLVCSFFRFENMIRLIRESNKSICMYSPHNIYMECDEVATSYGDDCIVYFLDIFGHFIDMRSNSILILFRVNCLYTKITIKTKEANKNDVIRCFMYDIHRWYQLAEEIKRDKHYFWMYQHPL